MIVALSDSLIIALSIAGNSHEENKLKKIGWVAYNTIQTQCTFICLFTHLFSYSTTTQMGTARCLPQKALPIEFSQVAENWNRQ